MTNPSADFIYQIFWKLLIFLGGVVATLIYELKTGFVKEIFEERTRKRTHKINVANKVLKICNEASVGNYCVPPRDVEHVFSIMTDLDGVDEDMGKSMNEIVSYWMILSATKHQIRTAAEVSERNIQLVTWGNAIRAGKVRN